MLWPGPSATRRATIDKRSKIHVGLDVDNDSITVAAADPGRDKARLIGKVAHDLPKLLKVLARLGGCLKSCTWSVRPGLPAMHCGGP
jgi:hypothetical protein